MKVAVIVLGVLWLRPLINAEETCSSRSPCDECTGDCSSDSDCSGDLVCYQQIGRGRLGNRFPVPGCNIVDLSKTDYCVDPANIGKIPVPHMTDVVRFDEISVPQLDERHFTRSSESVSIGGNKIPIGFKSILKTGDVVSGYVAGWLLDMDGEPIYELADDGTKGDSLEVSINADFSSITKGQDGKTYMITHWEQTPGQAYAIEIDVSDDCEISIIAMQPVDFKEWGGLLEPCAGTVTPWGTHLGSEELDPDARIVVEFWDDPEEDFVAFTRYFKKYAGDFDDFADFLAVFNPYNYGYVTEIFVDTSGTPKATKWLTLGRLAVEMAVVMPDDKTVYVSDDDDTDALVAFVMDSPGDLSSGTLYAARFLQEAPGKPRFAVEWIPLASGTQAELMVLKDSVMFDDIFSYIEHNGSCPEGYKAVTRNEEFVECLQLKSGMEKAAAFFETRRYSSYVGGTIELSGLEGISYDKNRNKLYLAISGQGDGMLEGITSGESDFIILDENECGCIYQSDYEEIDGWLQLTTFYPLICGNNKYSVNKDNSCDVNNIAEPDNIHYMGNNGGPDMLLIGEDCDGHQNDYLWVYDLTTGELTRLLTTPYGSEVSSPYLYEDVDGCAFLTAVVQHPYDDSDEDRVDELYSTGKLADIGYIGPLPAFTA
jgi:uncharacterized protein